MPLTAAEQAELDELNALAEPTGGGGGGLTADETIELAELEALGKRPGTQQQEAVQREERRTETPVDAADRIIRAAPGNIGRGLSDMLGRILDPAGDDKAREKFALPERFKSDILPEFTDASPLEAAELVLGGTSLRVLNRARKLRKALKARGRAQGRPPAGVLEKLLSRYNQADIALGRKTMGGAVRRRILDLGLSATMGVPGGLAAARGLRAARTSPFFRRFMRSQQLRMQRDRGATTRQTGRPRPSTGSPGFLRGRDLGP